MSVRMMSGRWQKRWSCSRSTTKARSFESSWRRSSPCSRQVQPTACGTKEYAKTHALANKITCMVSAVNLYSNVFWTVKALRELQPLTGLIVCYNVRVHLLNPPDLRHLPFKALPVLPNLEFLPPVTLLRPPPLDQSLCCNFSAWEPLFTAWQRYLIDNLGLFAASR